MPAVTITRNDLVETLDRILDKGIVVNQEVAISPAGVLPLKAIEKVRIESISIQPHGSYAMDTDDLGDLFPYWRRDFWTK